MSIKAQPKQQDIKAFAPSGPSFEEILDSSIDLEAAAQSRQQPDPEPEAAAAAQAQSAERQAAAPQPKTVELPNSEDFDPTAAIAIKPAPEATPKKGERADAMREQLKKLAQEREELAKKNAEIEAKFTESSQTKAALEAKIAEREAELNRLRADATVSDPARHPDVIKLSKPWNDEAASFAADMEAVADADSNKVFGLVLNASKELANLTQGTPEYKAALSQIRNSLTDEIGENNLLGALKLVRDGAAKINEIKKVVSDIKSDLPRFQFTQQQKEYEKAKSEYEQIERTLFNPPEDIRQRDPYNQSVIMRAMIDASPEVKEAAERTKAFVRYVLLPPQPIPPDELEGLSDDQRSAKVTQHFDSHRKARAKLDAILAEALLARQLLPSVFKKSSEMETIVKNESRVIRPRVRDEQHAPSGDEPASIKEFKPSNSALDDFKKKS